MPVTVWPLKAPLAVFSLPVTFTPLKVPLVVLKLPATVAPLESPVAVLLLPVTSWPAKAPFATLKSPVTFWPLEAPVVGVNARDLRTLAVDSSAFGRLAPLVPDDRVLVAESGITGPDDVAGFVAAGARVVLVGEALVRDGDPEAAVRMMTGVR